MKSFPQMVSKSAVAAGLALLVSVGSLSVSPARAAELSPAAATVPGAPAVPASPSAEDEAAGKRHYKRGDELFKQGRFLDAAHEFEAGFAVAPRPLFLLNIGHSYRKAQELRRARSAYEEFLKEDPKTSYRADVEDLMKTIDDALGASSLPLPATPPPASPAPAVLAPSPPSPSGTPTLPPAPSPVIRAGTIDLAPPVLIEVDRPAAPTQASDSIFRSAWFWGAVGAVVAAGVVGTVYGLNRAPACNATRCLRETD
jgi:hypothetical protein